MNAETPKEFGEELRRERELRDVSREQLAAVTKVSVRQLEALETGRFEVLPALVFSRGFVTAIATHLGLDVEKTSNGFRHVYASWSAGNGGARRTTSPTSGTHPGLRSKRPVSATSMVVGVGIAAALAVVTGVAAVVKSKQPDRAIVSTPAAPAMDPAPQGPESLALPPAVAAATVALTPETAPATTTLAASAPSAEPASVSGTGQRILTLTFRDDCWTEVAVGGRVVAAQLFKRGESHTFTGAGKFTLTLGNAGGVDVAIDGRQIASIGGTGQVVRNFVLDKS